MGSRVALATRIRNGLVLELACPAIVSEALPLDRLPLSHACDLSKCGGQFPLQLLHFGLEVGDFAFVVAFLGLELVAERVDDPGFAGRFG